MMKSTRVTWLVLISIVLIATFVWGCASMFGNNTKNLSLGIGEKGADVVAASAFPIHRSKITTLLTYDVSKSVDVTLNCDGGKILFPTSTLVMFFSDADEGDRIEQIDMFLDAPAIKPKDYANKDLVIKYKRKTYDFVMGVLNNINSSGFNRYIFVWATRVNGLHSYPVRNIYPDEAEVENGDLSRAVVYSDPLAAITFDQWMNLYKGSELKYVWVKGDVFIKMIVLLDDSHIDKETSDIKITVGRTADLLPGPAEDYQKTIYPQEVRARAKDEAALRKLGVPIDESYVDPPLKGIRVPTIKDLEEHPLP